MDTPDLILNDALEWINAAAPRLEKAAEVESDLAEAAGIIAEKMASVGNISQDKIATTKADLIAGGPIKIAKAFEFLASQVSTKTQSLGKAASTSLSRNAPVARETADQAFERVLGL